MVKPELREDEVSSIFILYGNSFSIFLQLLFIPVPILTLFRLGDQILHFD